MDIPSDTFSEKGLTILHGKEAGGILLDCEQSSFFLEILLASDATRASGASGASGASDATCARGARAATCGLAPCASRAEKKENTRSLGGSVYESAG